MRDVAKLIPPATTLVYWTLVSWRATRSEGIGNTLVQYRVGIFGAMVLEERTTARLPRSSRPMAGSTHHTRSKATTATRRPKEPSSPERRQA